MRSIVHFDADARQRARHLLVDRGVIGNGSLSQAALAHPGGMEIRELAPAETHLAYQAMLELRPNIGTESEFVARVNGVQRPAGYRLVASFDDGDTAAAGAAGFHIRDMLAWGHYLYVEDLVTRESARRAGHATQLLDWIGAEAERKGCDTLQLDSGVHRHDAHRLYLRWGYTITGHHFGRVLREAGGR
jgi:GNAT superfamily N-acetyltransferase